MKVASFGIVSQRPEYPRHRNLLQGLRAEGVEVVECHFAMATSFSVRFSSVTSVAGMLSFALRLILSWLVLTARFLSIPRAEVVLVGHPGLFHVRLARCLSKLKMRRALVVLDVFTPVHETAVGDRGLLRASSFMARFLRWLERDACRAADLCLVDTDAHGSSLMREFGLPQRQCASVPIGPLYPPYRSCPPTDRGGTGFQVLYVGTYVPLHGVDTIIGAAELLARYTEIRFRLVGRGQERPRIENLVRQQGLVNIELQDWISPEELGGLIRSCDLALGCFGNTPKAGLVIPHKVYDAAAAGAALVTGDTVAAREILRHRESAFLVPPASPRALADAILSLREDVGLRRRMGAKALELTRTTLAAEHIGRRLREILAAELRRDSTGYSTSVE